MIKCSRIQFYPTFRIEIHNAAGSSQVIIEMPPQTYLVSTTTYPLRTEFPKLTYNAGEIILGLEVLEAWACTVFDATNVVNSKIAFVGPIKQSPTYFNMRVAPILP